MPVNPVILPVFLPHLGCREQCLFCNQKATAQEVPSPSSVREFIRDSLARLPFNRDGRQRQVGFYGGSFTAIDREDQIRYLSEVRPFLSSGMIDSIRISTRPDALGEEVLSLIRQYGVKTVEIGAQSMIDRVLSLSYRGHCAEDTITALIRLRQWGLEAGLHLMMGLPGDTLDHFLETIDRVIDLRPDFVRIHPTLVLRGAPLEALWRAGNYAPLSLDETVRWLKKGLLKLEKASIPVARIGLQPTRELEDHILAGPYHPALHQLVDSSIFFDMAVKRLEPYSGAREVTLFCHPQKISSVRGQGNGNILTLKEQFGLREVYVQGKEGLSRRSLFLRTEASFMVSVIHGHGGSGRGDDPVLPNPA